jgi:hypothetical protein
MFTKKLGYWLLVILTGFLALTTVAGGIGLLSGAIAPGLDLLAGSPFPDYTIPGLSLLVIVGGSALAATVLLLLHHPGGTLAALAAGVTMVGFELVEVLVIGSPAGLARNLQLFYTTIGLLTALLAAGLWLSEPGVSFHQVEIHLRRR